MPIGNHRFGQIGVHGGRTNANEYGKVMRVQALGRTDIDRRVTAQSIADQMCMHRCRCEDHCDTHAIRADILISQE